MKKKNLFLVSFLILSLIACAQNLDPRTDTSTDLQKLIFSRLSTPQNKIHIKKATSNYSTDDSGWITRIKENSFGFPSFDKEMVEKINSEIAAKTKDRDLSYNDLYYMISTEKVESFLSRKDREYIERQIKTAKQEQWDNTKYSYNFTDTISAIKISEPYFSENRKKAVVFIISPTLERAEFYKKVDGKWEFFLSSLLWIK